MKLNWQTDPITGDILFDGRVTRLDLMDIELDDLDRAVINEPALTAADMLQPLEIIFRRGHEQAIRQRRNI